MEAKLTQAEVCDIEAALGDPVVEKQLRCSHGLEFDEKYARGLSAADVRKRYPRLDGVCEACGYSGIAYVSLAHFLYGDW